jgi:exosortase
VPVPFVGDLSFLLGLAGVCALMAGTGALRRYGFALAFLLFMIPLPVALYTAFASPLQMLVSRIASVILNAGGIPVLCEGTMMTLPGGIRMFVAEACSGMRQLTGFLALTTAVAYLTPRPFWFRGVLVASAVPIALSANVARVTLTGWIMSHDPRYASGTFHTLEGLLMMGFGLALLRAECWVLDRLAAPCSRPTRRRPRPDAGVSMRRATESPARRGAGLHPLTGDRGRVEDTMSPTGRAALGVAILTVGLAAQAALEEATQTPRPPLKQPLATLPLRLGDWDGPGRAGRPGDPPALAGRRPPEPDLRGPEPARPPAGAVGQLLAARAEPAALAGDLPALGGGGPRWSRRRRSSPSPAAAPRP